MIVEISLVNIKFTNQVDNLLNDTVLTVDTGSFNIFLGNNGSGKTTLSYLISQFHPYLVLNNMEVDIFINDKKLNLKDAEFFWKSLSYTFQDPDCQYTELKVIDELNQMIPDYQLREKIIEKYQLIKFLKRNINTLSYGEKQRLLWAREFAADKDFYFLDEVGSYFDAYWQKVLFNDLHELKSKGKTICIFGHLHHNIKFDRIYQIENKEIKIINQIPRISYKVDFDCPKRVGKKILSFKPCVIKRGSNRIELDISFDLHENEIILIKGDNGSGKSSLFLSLANLIKQPKKAIAFCYNTSARVVFQNPYSQTIESTISSLLKGIKIESLDNSLNWIKQLDNSRDPLSLSFGEQKAIHVLSALHSKSKIILIDEFYTGLSEKLKQALEIEVVKALNSGKGIIISSHPNIEDSLPYSKKISI